MLFISTANNKLAYFRTLFQKAPNDDITHNAMRKNDFGSHATPPYNMNNNIAKMSLYAA